jgi:hypothetical protein
MRARTTRSIGAIIVRDRTFHMAVRRQNDLSAGWLRRTPNSAAMRIAGSTPPSISNAIWQAATGSKSTPQSRNAVS